MERFPIQEKAGEYTRLFALHFRSFAVDDTHGNVIFGTILTTLAMRGTEEPFLVTGVS